MRTWIHKGWFLAGLLGLTVIGFSVAPRALVVATFFGPGGVNCTNCDGGGLFEPAIIGVPLQTLAGAKWVASPNGTTYAGGIKSGATVHFKLALHDINTQVGTTHFLIVFTTAAEGGKPGRLHVRDTSPGAKGEIKFLSQPSAIGDTGLLETTYRTPGADNVLLGDGSNTSNDPLPWDHPINNPVIDFALNMSDLDPKATWGLTTVVFGIHRMPCHCEPGAPQDKANGCVPQNATDVFNSSLPPLYSPPQVYCPSPSSPVSLNSCGKPQPKAWSCAQVLDTDPPRDLPFSCSITGTTAKGDAIYTCSADAIASAGIPASSCTYTAKLCQ